MLSVPTFSKNHFNKTIGKININNQINWPKKHYHSIFLNYKNSSKNLSSPLPSAQKKFLVSILKSASFFQSSGLYVSISSGMDFNSLLSML